jgi:tetratricopeptide (TPR) repeat protein
MTTDPYPIRQLASVFADPNRDPYEVMALCDKVDQDFNYAHPMPLFWKAKCAFHDLVDHADAASLLTEALARDRTRAELWSLLASCAVSRGDSPSEYLEFLQRAVELEPTWPLLRNFLAQTLLDLGMNEEAEGHNRAAAAFTNTAAQSNDPGEAYYDSAVTGRLGNVIPMARSFGRPRSRARPMEE